MGGRYGVADNLDDCPVRRKYKLDSAGNRGRNLWCTMDSIEDALRYLHRIIGEPGSETALGSRERTQRDADRFGTRSGATGLWAREGMIVW